MNSDSIKKLTYTVNTFILFLVLGLMLFFFLCKATFLVYFSIPTIFVYLLGFLLIYKDRLNIYLRLVYIWITLYMSICTICLGYNYGFHLYSLSMIPIIYYTNYMAYKMGSRKVRTALFTLMIIACYLTCTIYVSFKGPVYNENNIFAGVFWISNSVIVFCFLIYYTRTLIRNIIDSEEKLKEMSYTDRLTGLYNRHYMMEKLKDLSERNENDVVAMIDLDDFKKINDIHGHNAGDYVLKKTAELMKETCSESTISRWGGEEFLILFKENTDINEILEKLRLAVDSYNYIYDGEKIKVSVTIGFARRENITSIDKWIQEADDKLYIGKKSGKNIVVK